MIIKEKRQSTKKNTETFADNVQKDLPKKKTQFLFFHNIIV